MSFLKEARFFFVVSICFCMFVSIHSTEHKLYIYENEGNIRMHDMFPTSCEHLSHNHHLNKKHHNSRCNIFTEEYGYNEGYGYYSAELGIYETWQYGMFRNIYSRLIRSPLRTFNKSEATMFFIPYDSGTESYMDRKGNYRGTGNELAPTVYNMLSKSSFFHKNYGIDHFMIHSTSMVAQGIGNKLKNVYDLMHNATIISFEYLPLIQWAQGRPFHQAMPFPSVYHHNSRLDAMNETTSNSNTVQIPALRPDHVTRKRSHLVSFFGSTRTNMPQSNVLRRSLEKQCIDINNYARNAAYGTLEMSHEYMKDLHNTYSDDICVHKSIERKDRNIPIIQQFIAAYAKSVFCLMPQGDTPLRKGVVDALLSGCIPVIITSTDKVMHQYQWLYSDEDIELAFIVYHIDAPEVMDIMKTLSKYSKEEVREKQERISKIALRSQYSIPPDCTNRQLPDPSESMTQWNPSSENKDAVDYMMDGFMKHVDKYVYNK